MSTILLLVFSWLILTLQNARIDLRQFSTNIGPKEAIEETANQNTLGVVKIRGYSRVTSSSLYDGIIRQISEGSGFIISEDGNILTNRHVVSSSNTVYKVTTSNGYTYDVKNIYRDPDDDIAIVDINHEQYSDNKLIKIDMGDSENIEVGNEIAALGNDPGKIEPTLLTGKVLGVDDSIVTGRNRRTVEIMENLIETDLNLIPGNSGSPLLDENGKAVGINTAVSRSGNISYSIPINQAKDFMETIS